MNPCCCVRLFAGGLMPVFADVARSLSDMQSNH